MGSGGRAIAIKFITNPPMQARPITKKMVLADGACDRDEVAREGWGKLAIVTVKVKTNGYV
jgi:hypothetical protein